MRTHFLKLLLLLLSLSNEMATEAMEPGEMPIIAFFGVPDWKTSEENFRTFSECGFTVSEYPTYESMELLVKACRIANKYGVKVVGRCQEMTTDPIKAATTLKKEDGFYGYFIQDEPTEPEIRQREKEIKQLRSVDSTHVFYLNLHPYYHDSWVQPTMKVKSYPEYLKTASATSCQQISFDFYPITTKGIRPTWYHNLEMIRKESLESGKPFWGFVLSVPHDVPFTPNTYYPTPTLASLRLQIYTNLAYGAQAIQYFTYWTPNSKSYNYHDAPVDTNGKKTKTYAVVQQMNRELKTVAKLFYGAKVNSVTHLGKETPQGTKRTTKMPRNLRKLKIRSKMGAIISELEKDGHHYLAMVNKSYEDKVFVTIKARNSIPRHLTKTLQEEEMKTDYTIQPGDILLFRLQ